MLTKVTLKVYTLSNLMEKGVITLHFTTSKELRTNTSEIIKKIQRGERYIITYRGKPVALMLPFAPNQAMDAMVPRAYEEAWKDIEETLQQSEPQHQTWQEAIKESRFRS